MIILSLDTTTRAGSVALYDDGDRDDRVIDERAGDATRSHAERLPGDIVALADAHRVALSAVDVFAVASGPGSFTGLRIGIATMQGLAFVHRRPLAGVSALEALAQMASVNLTPGTVVAAWMDAHRHEVFTAIYRVERARLFDPERLVELEGATVGTPEATIDRWRAHLPGGTVFAGDGAVRYADAIARSVPQAQTVPVPLLARAIAGLAASRARRGESAGPAAIQPLYVRRPDAEIARDEILRTEPSIPRET